MYRKPEKALGQSRRNVLFSDSEKKTGELICRLGSYIYSIMHTELRYAPKWVICSAAQHNGVQGIGHRGPKNAENDSPQGVEQTLRHGGPFGVPW